MAGSRAVGIGSEVEDCCGAEGGQVVVGSWKFLFFDERVRLDENIKISIPSLDLFNHFQDSEWESVPVKFFFQVESELVSTSTK